MRPAVLAAVVAFNPRNDRVRKALLVPTRHAARAVLGLLDRRRRRGDIDLDTPAGRDVMK